MKVTSSNGFFANSLSGAWQKRRAQASGRAKTNTEQANNAIKQQMNAQKQRHLSFLTRAREGMAFYQEKIKEAKQIINQYHGFAHEEYQEMVIQASGSIPEFEARLEELNQSIDNGIEENAFIMSTLEALLNEDGNFPVHTLEEYLKKKAEEEQYSDTNERPHYKKYTLEDLDQLISSLKKELSGGKFSVKV